MRKGQRVAFDNTETYFTGIIDEVGSHGHTMDILLDREYADNNLEDKVFRNVNTDYLEELGPDFPGLTDADKGQQVVAYKNLTGYNLEDRNGSRLNTWVDPETNEVADYLCTFVREGIKYYVPNDESWGIIAVDHEHKLAIDTGFNEMDDIEAEHGEYAQFYHDGKLTCGFELPLGKLQDFTSTQVETNNCFPDVR